LGINDVVINYFNVHLQTSNLTTVFRNSMFDRNNKDQPFCSYA
jgi:hypothetical protein